MNEAPDHFKQAPDGTTYAGDHLLIELWDAEGLGDVDVVEQAIESAAHAASASILHAYYHHFGAGQGVSGVTVLAESHISIHTWPERGYAAIDVFMCGDCDPTLTISAFEAAFRPRTIEQRLLRRGTPPSADIQSVA